MNGNPGEARRTALDLFIPLGHARTVILTGSAAQGRHIAQFMADAGARTVSLDLGTVPTDTRGRFAAYERLLAYPTETLRSRLDTEDPDCTALVYAGSFTSVKSVCGRRVIGARSASQLNAERKDMQRELFGLGGDIAVLAEGLARVSPPAVVQGVPDEGVAMATSHTYLVPQSADSHRLEQLAITLRRDCTRAMVTRFNAGTPCTFYGFVTATAVIDFGPVEALVYWDQHTWRIHAPGILRPLRVADKVLASARFAVQAIARRLCQELHYVGAFGTDGVLTDDGYTVHEINPRVCAGFSLLDRLMPEAAPLAAIDLVMREFPDSSTMLAVPLTSLASVLQQHPTVAFQLWETPTMSSPAPAEELTQAEWVRQIRTAASGGLQPIRELKEIRE